MRMWRGRKISVAAGVLAVAAMSASIDVAAVNPAAGVVIGTGTISPGLSIAPTAQTVTFSGTLAGGGVVTGAAVVVNDSCSVTASSDITETVAQGDGNASGSCSGTAAISGSLHYQRVGAAVVMTGSGTVNGAAVTMVVQCAFEPTSAPSVSSYALQCLAAFA